MRKNDPVYQELEDAFFAVRHPSFDTPDERAMFREGFERGYNQIQDQPKGATPDTSADSLTLKDIPARIMEYLCAGGLFNPELMDHSAVQGIMLDMHNALSRHTIKLQNERIAELESQLSSSAGTIVMQGESIHDLERQNLSLRKKIAQARQNPREAKSPKKAARRLVTISGYPIASTAKKLR